MIRVFIFVLTVALVGAFAVAQSDYADNSEGGDAASVTQTVTVTIPERVAVHITQTFYALDLSGPDAYDAATGIGCRMLRQGQEQYITGSVNDSFPASALSSGTTLPAWRIGLAGAQIGSFLVLETLALDNPAVQTYPAVALDSSGNVEVVDGNYMKGSLVCFNRKVVQKFSNAANGFRFAADVVVPAGVGQFGIVDRAALGFPRPGFVDGYPERDRRHLLSAGSYSDLTLATASPVFGTTGGWLDDNIIELFYFDGTEMPTSGADIVVTYILTGNF